MSSKRAAAIVLAAATVVSLAWVAVPVVLIRPFGPQTPRGLAISYALRLWSPRLTAVLLAVGAAAVIPMWRRPATRRGRSLAGLAVVLLAASAFLARQNHFEWMFRPVPRVRFTTVDGAKDVAEDDLVLGVRSGGEVRAYPVLALAYHHIVNDVLGGEPVVATY